MIGAEKAAANGSADGAEVSATGSGSDPNPDKALPNAASKMLPPTALPLPSACIGFLKLSSILISDEYGPNSALAIASLTE